MISKWDFSEQSFQTSICHWFHWNLRPDRSRAFYHNLSNIPGEDVNKRSLFTPGLGAEPRTVLHVSFRSTFEGKILRVSIPTAITHRPDSFTIIPHSTASSHRRIRHHQHRHAASSHARHPRGTHPRIRLADWWCFLPNLQGTLSTLLLLHPRRLHSRQTTWQLSMETMKQTTSCVPSGMYDSCLWLRWHAGEPWQTLSIESVNLGELFGGS